MIYVYILFYHHYRNSIRIFHRSVSPLTSEARNVYLTSSHKTRWLHLNGSNPIPRVPRRSRVTNVHDPTTPPIAHFSISSFDTHAHLSTGLIRLFASAIRISITCPCPSLHCRYSSPYSRRTATVGSKGGTGCLPTSELA